MTQKVGRDEICKSAADRTAASPAPEPEPEVIPRSLNWLQGLTDALADTPGAFRVAFLPDYSERAISVYRIVATTDQGLDDCLLAALETLLDEVERRRGGGAVKVEYVVDKTAWWCAEDMFRCRVAD